MGRWVDTAEIKRISEITHLSVSIHNIGDIQGRLPESNTGIFVEPVDEKVISGYALMKDAGDEPGFFVRVEMPRKVYEKGKKTCLIIFS